MKLSDYVLERVAAAGTRHVFLVPGGAAMHLNDSLGKTPGLRFVATLHEGAASVAAESCAKLTGKLGVAMVTAGPGSTNAITGVASAWVNSAPLLVLAGQVKSADLKHGALRQLGLQEVDIESIIRPITKYTATVRDPKTVRHHVEKAIHLAQEGRPGPVWLTFPMDIQAATIEPDELDGYVPEPASGPDGALAESVAEVLDALRGARRPVILAGGGIRFSGAEDKFLELAAAMGVPLQTTWCALDLVPDDHPLYAGRPGAFASRGANFAVQNADVLVTIGARWDLATTGFAPARFAPHAKRYAVDVDPAEIAKMAPLLTRGIVANARDFVAEMARQRPSVTLPALGDWRARIAGWLRDYPIVTGAMRGHANDTSTYVFVEKLGERLGSDAVTVQGSSGIYSEIFCMSVRVKAGQRILCDGSFGAMGYGLPAAIGASIAHGKRTILIDGDGSFQPQAQELATVARERPDLKIFIVNNDGYSSIRASQSRYFGRLVAADRTSGLLLADIGKLAAAYGIPAVRVERESELEAALETTLATTGPAICEIVVPSDEDREPRLSSAQGPDGKMISKPLEDLFPFLDREELERNLIATGAG